MPQHRWTHDLAAEVRAQTTPKSQKTSIPVTMESQGVPHKEVPTNKLPVDCTATLVLITLMLPASISAQKETCR